MLKHVINVTYGPVNCSIS